VAEFICTLRDLRKVAGNVEEGVAEGRDLLLPSVPSRPGFLGGGSRASST